MILALAAALFSLPLPPDLPIPVELELCILRAELCAAEAAPACDEVDGPALDACIEMYESCSYAFPEAHDGRCRTTHAWCALELPFSGPGENPEAVDLCEQVEKLCPSWSTP